MREKILTLEYVLFLFVSSPHPFILYWYIYTPVQCQVGSFAVFILRHRGLIGGGTEDLQHIARVIVLNMVSPSPFLCLKPCLWILWVLGFCLKVSTIGDM
ncbi:hypothetical protein RHSIM_Rhsim05G0118600 [Rhododendron simsii]|uniref:Uncharacterized protein n=1 Tax=Rhododendron simsii TaxID=118357 RepID=A0A834GVR0_RHOSS|nr:hypothetical protein RHSIM_Rhsim05G0118600 [Rhododendron simsii]